MLRLLIALSLSLFLIKNACSQTGYTINGEHLTCLTEPELDSVLVTYIHLDECREIQDTLIRAANLYQQIITSQDTIILQQQQDSILQAGIIKEYIQQNKQTEKLYRKQRTSRAFFEVSTYVLLGTLAVLTPLLYFSK